MTARPCVHIVAAWYTAAPGSVKADKHVRATKESEAEVVR